MELRHLKYFVAVGEELHISRAAQRLHVAQPAVSEQIQKLERELGVQLLDRRRRRISLTDAGAAFLDEARKVLEQAHMARLAARAAHAGMASRLRLGYVSVSLPITVPQALQRLAANMPSLRTSMREGETLQLIDDLREDRLDVAIVPLPAPTGGLRATLLGAAGAVAAVPVRHRHATSGSLRLAQIAPESIVVLPREANRGFYDAILGRCRDANLAPTLVELPDGHLERALLAVAAGAGMALLPQAVAERYVAPGVRFIPIEDESLSVTTAALTPRDNSNLPTVALIHALARASEQPASPDARTRTGTLRVV